MLVESFLNAVSAGQVNAIDHLRHKFGKEVCRDGVSSEDKNQLRPRASVPLGINDPVTGSEANQRQACSENHVGTCPQFLIDGEPQVPSPAQGDCNHAYNSHAYSLRSL